MMSSFDFVAAVRRCWFVAVLVGYMVFPLGVHAQSPVPVMPPVNPPKPAAPATAAAPGKPGTPGGAATPGTEKPEDPNEKVKISVSKMALSDKGLIVFAVRIQAKGTKDLVLGTAGYNGAPDKSFTMEKCILENVATGRKFKALNDLPNKPYYGPMVVLAGIRRGEWLELGVCFPKLPPPPPENQGKPVEYKLTLPIPGSEEAKVSIPEDLLNGGKTAAAPKAVETPAEN